MWLAVNDQTVRNAYRSMADFKIWDAWTKVWMALKLYGDLWIFRSIRKYESSGDLAMLAALDEEPRPGAGAPFAKQTQGLLDLTTKLLDELDRGSITVDAVASQMLKAFQEADWLPQEIYGWGSSTSRHIEFTDEIMMKLFTWGNKEAPAWIRDRLFDFPPPGAPNPNAPPASCAGASAFLRVCAESAKVGNFTLPKGANVLVSPLATHHDPNVYPDSERFNPQRWESISPPPYAYLPFGAGPRTCIALLFAERALRLMLPMILQRYRISIPENSRVNRLTRANIMMVRDGLPVNIEPFDRTRREPLAIQGL